MLFRTVALLSLSSTALSGAGAKLIRTRFEKPEGPPPLETKVIVEEPIPVDRKRVPDSSLAYTDFIRNEQPRGPEDRSGDTEVEEVNPLAYTDYIRDEERNYDDWEEEDNSLAYTDIIVEEPNPEDWEEENFRHVQPPLSEGIPSGKPNPPLVKWQGDTAQSIEPVHEENTNERTETLYGEDDMVEIVYEDSNGAATEEPEDDVFDSEQEGADDLSAAGTSFSVEKDANCSAGFDKSKGGMTQHCEAGMKQEFSMNVSAQEMNQGIGSALMEQGSEILPEPEQLVLKNDEMEALFMRLSESNLDVAKTVEFSGTMKLDWSCKMTFEATKDKGVSKKVECGLKSDSSVGKKD
eukprot:scaffold25096_cov181-Cylindrotheca_fusiformis.AAC.2